MNTPMSAALFDQYFLNYGLIERVIYLPDSVELRHRGNAFGIVRQGDLSAQRQLVNNDLCQVPHGV